MKKMTVFDVDDFLMDDYFQPLSHACQKNIGISSLDFAKIFFHLLGISTLWFLYCLIDMQWRFATGYFMISNVITISAYYLAIKKVEKKYSEPCKEANANPYRLSFSEARTTNLVYFIFLILVLIMFYDILPRRLFIALAIHDGLELLFLYFISCTPLPPGTSKFKSWVNKLSRKATEVFSPEPCPVPTKRLIT